MKNKFLYYAESGAASTDRRFGPRWEVIRTVADFRPTHKLLDVGCADGLMTMESATRCASAHGFEYFQERVEWARSESARRGLKNVTFECGSIFDKVFTAKEYDVTLFLNVFRQKRKDVQVGYDELENLLKATAKQMVMQTDLVGSDATAEQRLERIQSLADRLGFDSIAFARPDQESGGNTIVLLRRGTDVRLPGLLPLILSTPARLVDPGMLDKYRGAVN